MPAIRKLDPDEISAHKRGKLNQQQQAINCYDALLANLALDEWFEINLGARDGRLKVRNRLVVAAKRRGLRLAFRCSSGNHLGLEVKVTLRSEVDEAG